MSPHDDSTRELLQELLAIYGTRLTRLWDGADAERIRRAWARHTASLTPGAIEWALTHLPPDPVNPVQFRALALSRPPPNEPRALPGPKPDPVRVAALLAPLKASGQRSARAWIAQLTACERHGMKLTPAVLRMLNACRSLQQTTDQAHDDT
jgi:hypothetical protein